MTKKAKKNRPKATKKSLIDLMEDEIREQIAMIGQQRQRSPEFDKDLALSTAALQRALIAGEGERRQAKKGRVRSLGEIPLDEIVDYLLGLPEEKREAVARRLSGGTEEASLL